MPEPGCSARWSASQASRCSAVLSRTTPRRSDSRSSEPRSTSDVACPSCSATSSVTRALAVAVVASTGMPSGQVGEQGADPAVVGPEVVAPVGDAVRLVDDQQAAGRGQPGQHLVAEAGVVEPLGADQQHVDLAGRGSASWIGSQSSMLVELMVTARMPARSAAAIWLRISASSGETITVGPGALARAAARWRRSRPPTCPSRCAARPAPGAGRRPAPRSRSTGPRAARASSRPTSARRWPRPRGAAYVVGVGRRVVSCPLSTSGPTARRRRAVPGAVVRAGPRHVAVRLPGDRSSAVLRPGTPAMSIPARGRRDAPGRGQVRRDESPARWRGPRRRTALERGLPSAEEAASATTGRHGDGRASQQRAHRRRVAAA